MSSPPEEPAAGLTPAQRRERRERLARVFGESLPTQTSDDRDPESAGSEGPGADEARDRWYREQRPPHHGG